MSASRDDALQLRVVPNARRSECLGAAPGSGEIRIKLAAPAVDGKANKALLDFLATALGVPKSTVDIVRGQKGRSKAVTFATLDSAAAHRALLELAEK